MKIKKNEINPSGDYNRIFKNMRLMRVHSYFLAECLRSKAFVLSGRVLR